MGYSYHTARPMLFTEKGQVKLLAVRDRVGKLLKEAGAVKMWPALDVISGDTWEAMACMDRLVELGEIYEVTKDDVAGQDRVFVRVARTA
jgi:hypothetical protein